MISITQAGLKVGHASDPDAITGCTVLLFDKPAAGAIDLRGGGTSTRQIDSLLSHNTFGSIHGLLLTGGSAFGLDAAGGVMRYLEERRIGLDVGYGLVVPSVPTAVIFDIGIGKNIRPDAAMGYKACLNASYDGVEEGSVGAGTGATIGKLLGLDHATKGGLGTAAYRFDNGVVIGVIAVVNAFGDVVSREDGRIVAGARKAPTSPEFAGTVNLFKEGVRFRPGEGGRNTTLAVVAVNARFSKPELGRIASIAQTGLSRVISPAHTVADGDVVMAVSCGDMEGDANVSGIVAAELVEAAIMRAVHLSRGMGGVPSVSDLKGDGFT